MKKQMLIISVFFAVLASNANAGTICRATNADGFSTVQTFGYDLETWKAFYIDMFDDDKRVEGEIRFKGPDDKRTDLNLKFYTMKSPHSGEYKYTELHVFNIRSEDDSRLQMFGGKFDKIQAESYMNQLIDSHEYECFKI